MDAIASDQAAGSTTVVSHAARDGSDFRPGLRDYFEYRDLGIQKATGGGYAAHVIRAVPDKMDGFKPEWHDHETTFQMFYVLKGWVEFEYADIGTVRMDVGSSAFQPDRMRHRQTRCSEDLELLEIVAPGDFRTNAGG